MAFILPHVQQDKIKFNRLLLYKIIIFCITLSLRFLFSAGSFAAARRYYRRYLYLSLRATAKVIGTNPFQNPSILIAAFFAVIQTFL